MARNHKFYFDKDGSPKARGPAAEKVLMNFLETDVQGSDHICRDLMDDLTAIEDESDDAREFNGNAHSITMTSEGVVITDNFTSNDSSGSQDLSTASTQGVDDKPATSEHTDHNKEPYTVALKHFREVLEDWEAFILDDQLDDPLMDDEYL